MLREAEILLSQRHTVKEVVWKLEIAEQTYYRWCRDYCYVESLNGKMRDELLDRELFFTWKEA